jgi:uncharacterized repeat protein (TIGR01451 family)
MVIFSRWFAALAFVVALLCGAPVSAQARPVVELHLAASLARETKSGESFAPVSGEVPRGSVIRYMITAANAGSDPARRLISVGKVPAGTEYVSGSAKALGARVEFSLDGGRMWSAVPTFKVRSANGLFERNADPRSYNRIRFVAAKPLAPHAVAQYTYEVRVK